MYLIEVFNDLRNRPVYGFLFKAAQHWWSTKRNTEICSKNPVFCLICVFVLYIH